MPNVDWRQFQARRLATEAKDTGEITGPQKFQERWSALEAHAWNFLENSELIDPSLLEENGDRIGAPRIRFWDNNLKVRPTSWTLFEPPGQVVWIVREAIWEEAKDSHNLMEVVRSHTSNQTLAPSFQIRDAWVPGKELITLLKEANTFSIPLLCRKPRESGGRDGRSRGLDFQSPDDPPALVRLQWSDTTPEEWHPVLHWLERMKSFLAKCLTHPKCMIARTPDEAE